MACPSNIDNNYIKLQLVVSRANQLIQSKFSSEWKAEYGEKWQKNKPSSSVIQFVSKIYPKPNRSQKELMKMETQANGMYRFYF